MKTRRVYKGRKKAGRHTKRRSNARRRSRHTKRKLIKRGGSLSDEYNKAVKKAKYNYKFAKFNEKQLKKNLKKENKLSKECNKIDINIDPINLRGKKRKLLEQCITRNIYNNKSKKYSGPYGFNYTDDSLNNGPLNISNSSIFKPRSSPQMLIPEYTEGSSF